MKKLLVLLVATGMSVAEMAWSAQAMPMASAPTLPAPIVKAGFICGPGYHLGPGGRYCWPNGARNIPPHWRKACPPGFHLGPKGRECWPN